MVMQGSKSAAAIAALALLVAACGDGTGVGSLGDEVSLSFRVSGTGGAALAPSANPSRVGPAAVAGSPMVLDGTNGTLTLDEIRLVINKVELETVDSSCGVGDGSSDGSDDGIAAVDSGDDSEEHCGEFQVGPRFLDLPLDGQSVEAVTSMIPAGTYDRLKFKIEDLEDDEDDVNDASLIAEIRAQVLAEFPDWPRAASALVVGSFQPTDGDPIAFRVFVEAEVEIEMDLVPNLVVDDAGTTSRELTVDVSPGDWFTNPDGTVLDLSAYDFDTTGQLLEFEVEMEHGFTEIEFEHD